MKRFIASLIWLGLQLFAEAGTLVNTTQNYVNAYTGEAQEFDTNNSFSGELKTYYDTELLENARPQMIYAQFAKKQPLPANHGKTVEWRKFNTFARAGELQEGVIPQGQKFGMSYKTGSITQHGTYTTLSDQIETRAYDNVIQQAAIEMAASAAETQEVLIRDGLATNTNVMYCDVISAQGAYVKTPTSGAELYHDSSNGFAYLTPDMVHKAMTKLKKDKAPTIGGDYVCVLHPSVAYDIRNDKNWEEWHKYAAPEEQFNGEIGRLHGVRFVENNFAPIWKGADLSAAARTLTVASYTSGTKTVGIDETLTSDDQAALVGRTVFIDGVAYIVKTAAASSFTVEDAPASNTPADGDVIYPGEGAALGDAAYPCYFFGKDAFGIIDPAEGNLQMIAHSKGEIGGPLNQFSTVGYKFEFGEAILYTERMLRVMAASAYSGVDEEQ